MRKLASVRKVLSLSPIPGADFIERATIDGWEVVVKKGEFQVNDLCIFFEIDSFLPDTPTFAFLGTPCTYEGRSGHRLKTVRLRKCISQGLALPLSSFGFTDLPEGTDLTDVLNVIKYDNSVTISGSTPGLKAGNPSSSFPSFIPKTDQERIQNLTHYFESYADLQFEETLKLDGSSCTMYKVPSTPKWYERVLRFFGYPIATTHFGVCSRNLEIKRSPTSDFWKVADSYSIESRLPVGYAIQGELIGPRIQSNHEKVTSLQYYVFDVYDISAKRYLLPSERHLFCQHYDLPHVPIVSHIVSIFKECPDLPSLLARVDGPSMNPDTVSEGRVYKCTTNHITFKCINNKYLLHHEQ